MGDSLWGVGAEIQDRIFGLSGPHEEFADSLANNLGQQWNCITMKFGKGYFLGLKKAKNFGLSLGLYLAADFE